MHGVNVLTGNARSRLPPARDLEYLLAVIVPIPEVQRPGGSVAIATPVYDAGWP